MKQSWHIALRLASDEVDVCLKRALCVQATYRQRTSGLGRTAERGLLCSLLIRDTCSLHHLVPSFLGHNAPGLGEDNFDGAHDRVIRDLQKRLSRARTNAESAYRTAAIHRRSAGDADLALDEVCNPCYNDKINM